MLSNTPIFMKVFKCPEPEGVLRVTVVEAKNLMQCDFALFSRGQSDPYTVLTVGAKRFRTKTVKKTVNPEFGESWECVVDMVRSQMLDIEVWDQDQGKDDDFMGRARVPIHVLAERGVSDLWVSLEEATSGQVRRSGQKYLTVVKNIFLTGAAEDGVAHAQLGHRGLRRAAAGAGGGRLHPRLGRAHVLRGLLQEAAAGQERRLRLRET